MGTYNITIGFELNEAQELLVNNIYITCRDKFNYTYNDVIGHIIHSDLYYELMDDKRKEYNDLYLPIVHMIADREDKWNRV